MIYPHLFVKSYYFLFSLNYEVPEYGESVNVHVPDCSGFGDTGSSLPE